MPPPDPATPPKKKTGDDVATRSPATSPATAPTTTPGFPDPAIMADPLRGPRDGSPNNLPPGGHVATFETSNEDLDALLRRRLEGIGELEQVMREKMRELDVKLGIAAEEEPAKVEGPGKLLGHVPVYANDTMEHVIERARGLRRGNIPVSMARRFRTAARINAVMNGEGAWPMAKRLKEAALPLGFEFDAEEMPLNERVAFFEAGAIEAIE